MLDFVRCWVPETKSERKATVFLQSWWEEREDVHVDATLSYENTCLLISFHVEGPELRRVEQKWGDPAYQDSCVEFFGECAGGGAYVNVEMGAGGAVLAARGAGRKGRVPFSEAVYGRAVSRRITILSDTLTHARWRLDARLDLAGLGVVAGNDLKGMTVRGNVYATGDLLRHPLYLAWNPVDSLKPDFHRPEDFGEFTFF